MVKFSRKTTWICIGVSLLLLVLLAVSLSKIQGNQGYILYVKNLSPDDAGIYVMNSDASEVERLTPWVVVKPPLIAPSWSPDGKRIAYGCAWLEKENENNICLMGSEGLFGDDGASYPDHLLTTEELEQTGCHHLQSIQSLSWSPEGDRIAFTGVCQMNEDEFDAHTCVLNLDGDMECWPVSTIANQETAIVNNSAYLDWSPTDDTLAISFRLEDEKEGSVYLSDLTGHDAVFLVEGVNPSWAPDGKKLLFIQDGSQISVIDRDGENLRCIYEEPLELLRFVDPHLLKSTATWSPSGKMIAFRGSCNFFSEGEGIYLLNIRTGDVKRLTVLDDGVFSYPDWSP